MIIAEMSLFMSYYISPRFLDKVAIHITKNFLQLPQVRVPLILGIHGRKGEGKTFQCELVFAKMGFEPVMISGGELESPDAGDPARLLRLRYREAAEQIRVRGRMCALFINDFDAGAGRFDAGTQYTVNTQLVNATLMNIADNPTNVQLPGSYDDTPLHRVPIILTGNDFSTLYAPLIRDGRMEKFYWEPNREDRVGIVGGIFHGDGLSAEEMQQLVDQFPQQSIDFFSALRSRIYDEQIRDFIHQIGFDRVSSRLVNSTEKAPDFTHPNFSLSRLIEFGQVMVQEQQQIQALKLVEEYHQSRLFGGRAVKSEAPAPPTPVTPVTPSSPVTQPPVTPAPSAIKGEIIDQVQQILAGGYRVSLEYADRRRFRTGSWQSYPVLETQEVSEILDHIHQCLANHPQDYIRLIGIDSQLKRRVVETLIHQPT